MEKNKFTNAFSLISLYIFVFSAGCGDGEAFLVDRLKLHPVHDGIYLRETYRGQDTAGSHSGVTVAYYLISGHARDFFHRLRVDEVWNYHAGSAVRIYSIDESGALDSCDIGGKTLRYTYLVKAHTWYCAKAMDKDAYALFSLLTSPGFHPEDYEPGQLDTLLAHFPQHADLIQSLSN